jgi:hypothetical protein
MEILYVHARAWFRVMEADHWNWNKIPLRSP